MKSLHKKISAVILAVILVLPVLSQGFVAYADLNVKKVEVSSIDEFQDYKYVLVGENVGKYDSLYLGRYKELDKPEKLRESLYLGIKEEYNNYERPKNAKPISIGLKNGKNVYAPLIEYPDGKRFLEGVKKGVLNKYRARYEFVVVKVGNLYFQLFLKLSPYQRQDIMMKLAAKAYNFEIKLSNRYDDSSGRAEMNLKIMKEFEKQPELMNRLLEGPKSEHIFKDVPEFISSVKSGKIEVIKECGIGVIESIGKEYDIYQIGDYAYVLRKGNLIQSDK